MHQMLCTEQLLVLLTVALLAGHGGGGVDINHTHPPTHIDLSEVCFVLLIKTNELK